MDIEKDFVHLSRFSLNGKTDDILAIIRKSLREIIKKRPDLKDLADPLMKQVNTMGIVRSKNIFNEVMPVDNDSRLELIKREEVIELENALVLEPSVQSILDSVIYERTKESDLLKAGLTPTRSILLVGPPGVGKTLSARWIAMKLQRPLLILDLAAVMSSYLGKTGNNIRAVLEYARKFPSVLLLDEFDSIAKRRDDATELGELKRLVTVLLQTVDSWPAHGLLLAATNHPELLDPAIWRRFDRVVKFPNPRDTELEVFINNILAKNINISSEYLKLMAWFFEGNSFSEVENTLKSILRTAITEDINIKNCLDAYLSKIVKHSNASKRIQFAKLLNSANYSQREISELSGCSRDTLRKNKIGSKSLNNEEKGDPNG